MERVHKIMRWITRQLYFGRLVYCKEFTIILRLMSVKETKIILTYKRDYLLQQQARFWNCRSYLVPLITILISREHAQFNKIIFSKSFYSLMFDFLKKKAQKTRTKWKILVDISRSITRIRYTKPRIPTQPGTVLQRSQ